MMTVDAYRRAAAELAREVCDSNGETLGTAACLFYAVEAESRLTGRAPDEIAIGDPFASEALEEVARTGLRTHRMRGWLHRSWEQVIERAESLIAVTVSETAGTIGDVKPADVEVEAAE